MVSFWNADGAFLGEVRRHKGPVLRLAFSPDNRHLANQREFLIYPGHQGGQRAQRAAHNARALENADRI